MLTDLHNALCVEGQSLSPFRTLGEQSRWSAAQLVRNMDGFDHPKDVEWKAERGSQSDLALLQTLSAGNPLQYPDRANDIKLAQTVLARVQGVLSGQTPPNVPGTLPPSVQPAVDTNPVAPPANTGSGITTEQLMQWGRDAVTVLGVVGTWATSLHGILGQFLGDGSAAVTVPSLFGAATVAAGFSTVRHKNQLLRENARMKALAPKRQV
jgi:hypothetical protein